MQPIMQVSQELITPKIAERLLLANTVNRTLREGVAEKYAADMLAARWTPCVMPIVFYDDGTLANGQHRLWAIILSNKSHYFIIVRNLPRSAGLNIDTGLTRSLLDNARISQENTELSNALIAAARAIEFGNLTIKRSLSHSEALAIIDRHRPAATFAAQEVRRKSLLCGGAVLGAVGRAYEHGVDPNILRRFTHVLATGLYDGEHELAAIVARNYLLEKGAILHSSSMWRDTFLRLQNAISYFASGTKLSMLRPLREEMYPPIGAPATTPVPSLSTVFHKPANQSAAHKSTPVQAHA